MKGNVLIIIINYNTSHLIPDLIQSIEEERVNVTILILDNASAFDSYATLQSIKDYRLQVIRSGVNLGFTGGVNYALNYARNNLGDFKYFFLLNPDAKSCRNVISDLVELIENHEEAACISPQVLHLDGRPWYSGGKMNAKKGKVYNNAIIEKGKSNLYEVDIFSGCAALFDMSKVIKTGMFNEDLFMYYDEAEFSLRLKEKGYKILYTPSHKVLHDVSYTTKNISYLKTYYLTRNRLIVFGKSMNFLRKFYCFGYDLAYLVKNRHFKNVYYHFKGLYDFMTGKRGAIKV